MLRQASRIDPAFARIHYLMAKYACRGGDYRNAVRHIDRAMEIDENPLYDAMKF